MRERERDEMDRRGRDLMRRKDARGYTHEGKRGRRRRRTRNERLARKEAKNEREKELALAKTWQRRKCRMCMLT